MIERVGNIDSGNDYTSGGKAAMDIDLVPRIILG